MSKVIVLGGCGRVGLRFSLISANKGHTVTCIDVDEERINEIKQGALPFIETGAEIYLEEALKKKSLKLSSEYKQVSQAEIVVIAVGTPVDSNLNPSLEPVAGAIFDISEHLKKKQLVVFRNTISVEVLSRIKTLIEDKTGFKVGKDIYLAFAPELTSNENSIHDQASLPQPIGVYDNESFLVANNFFKTLTKGKISLLTPEEAMLSKLMKNTYSYIQEACSNEFYLIAQSHGANIHKIVNATNSSFSPPNPNVSGPGTHKEGWFLANRIPFSDLVTTAFKINESVPQHIVQLLENYNANKVIILGMTNKANSDDTSSSLGYKLRKALLYKNYEVYSYDPLLPEYSDSSVLRKSDVVILMTPHKEFENLNKIQKLVDNAKCLFIDLSGFWEETQKFGKNGIVSHEKSKSHKKGLK